MTETLPASITGRPAHTRTSGSMKFAHALTALALFTSSFDVLLVFKLGGNIRFAQVMLLGVIGCAIARIVAHGTILWPRGGYALALWTLCQGLLLNQSPEFHFSAELYLDLVFTVVAVFAVLQVYGLSSMVEPLMRTYLFSFVFVAGFGLYQLLAPALHLGAPFVAEWIVPGLIPRINGFNFEPSYYATYLVLGWIMLVELRHLKARIVHGRTWYLLVLLVSFSLLLSTSKTGWIVMLLEVFFRLGAWLLPVLRRHLRWFQSGRLLVPLPRLRVITAILTALVVFVALGFTYSRVVDLNILLAGSGLNGSPSSSATLRYGRFEDTMNVIHQHFWIGLSLGGVPATLAELKGKPVQTLGDIQASWGFPVPAEVFAASGFWAFLLFLWFFLVISVGERKLIQRNRHQERAKWLRALIRALGFEWAALCADQNLLRVYLWIHVTVLIVVAYNLRYVNQDGSPRSNGLHTLTPESATNFAQDWVHS